MHQRLSKTSESQISIDNIYLRETAISFKCRPQFSQISTHIYSSIYTQIHTCIRQIFVRW